MSTMYASQFNFMQPIENLQKTANNSKEFTKEKENLSKSALLMRQRSKPNGTRARRPSGKEAPLSPVCPAVPLAAPTSAATPRGDWGVVAMSDHSRRTENPIRKIVDTMAIAPNPNKSLIRLHLGDPTLTGTLPPCPVAVEAMNEALHSHNFDGYGPAIGILEAREAVARHCLEPTTADDVILTSGCSHSLQLAIEAIANPGDNILVPAPGFPLYSTLMRPHGIQDRFYRLDMSRGAMADLNHLESLIDSRTRAIVVNNPSNPTGVVFPKEHLEAILRIADKHKVPIIADEIYGDLTYDGAKFYPMATLEPKVPLISCDGIAKRYLVPGWRLGWVTVHDRHGVLTQIKEGMRNLAQKIVGPCALIQGALPTILDHTPAAFFDHVRSVLAENARIIYERLSRVPGLRPVRPQGAMYMMVGIDSERLGSETSFVQALISEESVYCLPGSAFHSPNWVRLVLAYAPEVTEEACDRIAAYCKRRYQRPAMPSAPTANCGSKLHLDSCGSEDDNERSDTSDSLDE